MKQFIIIALLILGFTPLKRTNAQISPDFQWGSSQYYNLNVGESLVFQNKEIKLLELKNHFNRIKIGNDTIWIKVSRRTLPVFAYGIRLFVADNKNVKAIAPDQRIHGMLTKDALICLSDLNEQLLDPQKYIFPVSFNDGFLWDTEENSHMFSYCHDYDSNPVVNGGINIDLHDARGKEKDWILAIENSTVAGIFNNMSDQGENETCILLKSESQKNIYYLYEHLYTKNIEVKVGNDLLKGEILGTIWGDHYWGYLHFAVIVSDTVPAYQNRQFNAVNIFPQLYELYFKKLFGYNRRYSKGALKFGQRSDFNGGVKNIIAFEEYSGKGWNLGNWNTTDRVEVVTSAEKGNARLRKVLFLNEKAQCRNPKNYYDFEINVHNGVYRIGAKIGDLEQASWQKVEFEGVEAGTFALNPGEFKWTSERVVTVNDGKLTIRIYIDETNKKVAGISEIIFQRAY